MVSVVIIWGLTIWLIVEAFYRVLNQDFEIDADIMLYTAIFAFFSNLIMMKILHGGHSHGGCGHSHGGHSHGGNSHGAHDHHDHHDDH